MQETTMLQTEQSIINVRQASSTVEAQTNHVLASAQNVAKATKKVQLIKNSKRKDAPYVSSYRKRRRSKIGGPVVSLESGIIQHRTFTDVIYVLLFVIYSGIMIFIATRSWSKGDPRRLLNGLDSWGNACGSRNKPIEGAPLSGRDFTGSGKQFRLDPTRPNIRDFGGINLCVSSCIDRTLQSPSDLTQYAMSNNFRLCRYDIEPQNYVNYYFKNLTAINGFSCPDLPRRQEVSIFNRCKSQSGKLVGPSSTVSSVVVEDDGSDRCQTDVISLIALDIHESVANVLILCGISIVIGGVMLVAMGYFERVAVWTVFVGCLLACISVTVYCWMVYADSLSSQSQASGDHESSQSNSVSWLIIGVLVSVVASILFIVLAVKARKISQAIVLFQEAARAIRQMPQLLLQPIWTLLAFLLIIGIFIWMYLYLVTTSKGWITEAKEVLQVFYLLGIIWIVLFVFVCEELVVAGAVADWYFTRNKDHLQVSVVHQSVKRLVLFHIGTALRGAIVIPATAIPRVIMGFISRETNAGRGTVANCCKSCCQICLTKYEMQLRFVSSASYTMTAIFGCPFWQGCLKSHAVMVGTADSMKAVMSVGLLIMFLGRITTALLQLIIALVLIKLVLNVLACVIVLLQDTRVTCTSYRGAAALWKNQYNSEICYIWAPLALSTVLSVIIAHSFLIVYEVTLRTLFMCFCEDVCDNNGESKPYFMGPILKTFLQSQDSDGGHIANFDRVLQPEESLESDVYSVSGQSAYGGFDRVGDDSSFDAGGFPLTSVP